MSHSYVENEHELVKSRDYSLFQDSVTGKRFLDVMAKNWIKEGIYSSQLGYYLGDRWYTF
ncbi:MAG: hypothetical protein HRU19_06580 [Pseudobacteriovorax sp.]|nr:hypothetical protein [Pseudobacteriovorax sp.]